MSVSGACRRCLRPLPRRLRRGILSFLLCLPLLAGLAPGADAQEFSVPWDWALKPAGVPAGGKFRLLFITSTGRDATSPNIGAYNTFVQRVAARGHAEIRRYNYQFRAVASTLTTDARDNTRTTGTGVPIYWLNGVKLADNYGDFYDGNWDNYDKKDENGDTSTITQIRTGSTQSGTKHSTNAIGAVSVRNGTASAGQNPFDQSIAHRTIRRSYYALSPVFVAGTTECGDCKMWMSPDSSPVTEGDNAAFLVNVSPPPPVDLTVGVVVTDASPGVANYLEFSNKGYKKVIVMAGQASGPFSVPTHDDGHHEGEGRVEARIWGNAKSHGGPLYVKSEPRSATVTVTDNEPAPPEHVPPTVSASTLWGAARPNWTVTEGENASFCFSIDGSIGLDGGAYPANHPDRFQVAYAVTSTSGRTLHFAVPELASDPEGSQRAREHSLTRDARYGALQLSSKTRVMCLDYYTDGEGGETLTARVKPGGNIYYQGRNIASYRAGSASTATVTVLPPGTNAEGGLDTLQGGATPLPVVTISADAASVTEGGDVTFTVTADPAPSYDLPVNVGVAQEMGAGGNRVGSSSLDTVTIRAGESSVAWTVTTMSDDVARADGTVVGRILSGYDYRLGARSKVEVALLDDGGTNGGTLDSVVAPVATGTPTGVTMALVAEVKGHIAHFKARNHGAGVRDWTLVLDRLEGRTGMTDEAIAAWLARSRLHGWQDGIQTLPKVQAALAALETAPEHEPEPVTLPAVSVAAGASPVTEGGDAVFTLTASPLPASPLAVSVTVAASGAYGVGAGSQTVTVPTTGSFTLTLATANDDADEPDGSVTVTVTDGDGYTVGSSASGTVAVRDDDDPPPVVSIAAARPSIAEGGVAAFTVSADRAPDADLTVTLAISEADATVTEGEWAEMMPFAVRLSAPAAKTVRVRASTRVSSPVSARPKEDYWPLRSDLVTFYPGETEKTTWVYVYNDNHDEDPETFEVVLSAADGATIGDGVAVGTIVNNDPMPAAWLSRFGRTVAEQALDGIAGRLSAPRTRGMQGTVAGQSLSFDTLTGGQPGSGQSGAVTPGGTGSLALANVVRGFDGPGAVGPAERFGDAGVGNGFGSGPAFGATPAQSRTMTAREVLLGSSFTLTGATDGSGGSMAFWGRAGQGNFGGRDGLFLLDGEATTAMLGADYARGQAGGRWLVGLALVQSAGKGDYRDTDVAPRPDAQTCPDGVDGPLCEGAVRAGDGKVEASLTAVLPYASLQASERLRLWGAAGYGSGEVTLKTALEGSYKSDTTWSMAAAGLRGDLLAPPAEGSGPALGLTSDALWARTSSEKTRDLAASDSDVTRLRLGLEGSYRTALGESGGHLTPKLEIGARHDGGDAETGFGVEIGGGIVWVDPTFGLSLDVSGRTLIAHGNDDLKDQGYAASLSFDPDPVTARGPSFALRQDWGGQASGGLDALFQSATLDERSGSEATSRWGMEAAYGFPAFDGRFTGSPHVGVGLATGVRDYSVGWRLTPEAESTFDLSFGLRGTRRESDMAEPEHTVGFEVTGSW